MSQEAPKLSPSLTILKFLVIAMGITMIVGFLFLLGIIYRTVDKEKANECDATHITLPTKATITSITNTKNKHELSLLLNQEDGSQSIAIINECKGTLLRELKVIDSPKR